MFSVYNVVVTEKLEGGGLNSVDLLMVMIVDHPPQACTENGGRLNSKYRVKRETMTNTAGTRPNNSLCNFTEHRY